MKYIASLILALSLSIHHSFAQEPSNSPEGSSVYIISPEDGQIVQSPFKVSFGLSGMGIAPAGSQIESTGHHHLVIDADLPDLSQPIPSSDNYRHFGKGQTEVEVDLPPGTHTLQLLLGDWLHRPHNPPVYSEVVTVTVE